MNSCHLAITQTHIHAEGLAVSVFSHVTENYLMIKLQLNHLGLSHRAPSHLLQRMAHHTDTFTVANLAFHTTMLCKLSAGYVQ